MKAKKSRFALVGVLALATCVTVGLATGSVADAKKKKKKGGGTVTVSQTAPTAIPPAVASTPAAEGHAGFVSVPLTVGNKAKGKVVGWDTLTVTSTFTGSSNSALIGVFAEVTAPNGRTAGLFNPVSDFFNTGPTGGNTTSGPLTETPNSPFGICIADPGPPPNPPCFNPENTVGPPNYAGTIGNPGLEAFGGVPAKGTWTVKLFNSSTTSTATLNSLSMSMNLKANPSA
jgi:hypothetical protein